MGINIGRSRSHLNSVSSNPNPRNFQILEAKVIGKHVVLKVRYPDASNYEGIKIMVLKFTNIKDLMALKTLDPHFQKDNPLSPIARFEPTAEGWKNAVNLASSLEDGK
jgi:hypothetical protein